MSEADTDDTPERFDVLRYPDGTHRAIPAGDGAQVVAAHESEAYQRRVWGSVTVGVLPPVGAGVFAVGYLDTLLVPFAVGLALGPVAGVARYLYGDHRRMVPEVVATDVSARVADEYVEDFDPDAVADPFG